MKTMGEYHDLYLKSDILLLADVFEIFRKTCLQYYKIDPCHYFISTLGCYLENDWYKTGAYDVWVRGSPNSLRPDLYGPSTSSFYQGSYETTTGGGDPGLYIFY